jgi:transcriptional regulator with XRE-family HTH domain
MANQIEPIYEALGTKIQEVREKLKMTQAQLGESLVPQSTRASIANIESGKQRVLLHTFVQLAQVLKVDMKDLLPTAGPVLPSPSPKDVERELSRKLNLAAPQLKKLTGSTGRAISTRRAKV